ncbi:MAG: hypothetical protein GX216_08770 [Methanomicrobiales archaeon]|nr:hypothetical protein [Methanomicrobiales archaeon]
MDRLPRSRPSRPLTTRTPLLRGVPWEKDRMVLLNGEGGPSPVPSPGDCHHGPVHGMTPAKEDTLGPSPRSAAAGIIQEG